MMILPNPFIDHKILHFANTAFKVLLSVHCLRSECRIVSWYYSGTDFFFTLKQSHTSQLVSLPMIEPGNFVVDRHCQAENGQRQEKDCRPARKGTAGRTRQRQGQVH